MKFPERRLINPVPIGKGAQGEVVRYTDTTLDRYVAIKSVSFSNSVDAKEAVKNIQKISSLHLDSVPPVYWIKSKRSHLSIYRASSLQ